MTRHLLAIDDVEDDFEMILKWAVEFKRLWKEVDDVAVNFMPLDTLSVGSIYEKPSTRTRVSFEVGINRLGGYPLTLLKNEIQRPVLIIGCNPGDIQKFFDKIDLKLGKKYDWYIAPSVSNEKLSHNNINILGWCKSQQESLER